MWTYPSLYFRQQKQVFSRGNATKLTVLSVVYFILDSSSGYQYDPAAFLFSLVNEPGWPPQKLDQTGAQSHYKCCSIYRGSYYGPTFGGHDMLIVNDAAASNSDSYLSVGHTYSLPAGAQSTFLLGHDHGTSFRPDEVEVFYETT